MIETASASKTVTTVGEWFADLEPPPPPALIEKLQRLITDDASKPVSEVPEVCLRAGENLLRELLASGSMSRGTALDLLSVDALVTYAFEAGASNPEHLEQLTSDAMMRIGALAAQVNAHD